MEGIDMLLARFLFCGEVAFDDYFCLGFIMVSELAVSQRVSFCQQYGRASRIRDFHGAPSIPTSVSSLRPLRGVVQVLIYIFALIPLEVYETRAAS